MACSYTIRLQWEDDSIAAGKSHGRSKPWSKQNITHSQTVRSGHQCAATNKIPTDQCATSSDDGVTSSPHSSSHSSSSRSESFRTNDLVFVNTDSQDMRLFYDANHPSEYSQAFALTKPEILGRFHQPISLDKSLLPSYPGSNSSLLPRDPKRPDNDAMLLAFFENVVCARSTLIDDHYHNMMRKTLLPAGLSSEVVYNAVLMASAHYLRNSDSKYFVTELQLRQRTLAGLRTMLASDDWNKDVLVLTVIVLCSFDVSISLATVQKR